MPNKEQLTLYHRENYPTPKGKEVECVHYKIAKMTNGGEFIERPKLVKTSTKLFDTVIKRNLELQGYTIEILFHPNGTYTNEVIKDVRQELADKDAEIKRLMEELEKAKGGTPEMPEAQVEEKKKGGRPKKEA